MENTFISAPQLHAGDWTPDGKVKRYIPKYITRSHFKQADIIEKFVCQKLSIRDLANQYSMDWNEVHEIVIKWYPHGKDSITLPSIATMGNQDFIKHTWSTMSIDQIMNVLGCSKSTIQKIAIRSHLPRKEKVFVKGPNVGHRKKSIILNQETGIYYHSISEAAKSINVTEEYLKHWVQRNPDRNKTQFIYLGLLN